MQLDNLHAVKQGAGDSIECVGCSNEQTVGKIKWKLYEVVAEGLVLLGVKHFKQRRGRVAVGVSCQLVDLVE